MRTSKHPQSTVIELAPMPPLAAGATSRGSVTWDAENGSYLLTSERVQYRVLVGSPEMQSGLLHVEARLLDNRSWQPLLRGAGMLFRAADGVILTPEQTAEHCTQNGLRHSSRGRVVSIRYTECLDHQTLKRGLEIRLVGDALELRIDAPGSETPQGYCGFSLGQIGSGSDREIYVSGLPLPLFICAPDGFAAGYADRFCGQASSYTSGNAFYRPDTAGAVCPIVETFYLTLSPDPLGPLPQLKHPAASYRDRIAQSVTFDWYSEAPYEEDAFRFRMLAEYGFQDVQLIYRNWQHYGYRHRGPLLYPADSERGTNEMFRRMLEQAHERGWSTAIREEYATMALDSPYWDEEVVPVWPDGMPRRSLNGEPALAAHRMIEFARLEATKIQRNYRTTASFVDGHTAWNPEGGFRQVDAAANSPSDTEAKAIREVELLFQFLRRTHEGPVIGAGGEEMTRFDTLAAGMAEGALRGPDGGQHGLLAADYELFEVRPRLLGIGAGSYSQFFTDAKAEYVEPNTADLDWYRATEIALAHTGYVSNYGLKPGPRSAAPLGGDMSAVAREYYLLRALQELYADAPLRRVLYEHRGELIELREMLLRDLDLINVRLQIEYGNGLVVWVNRARAGTWTVRAEDQEFILPPGGFVAIAPKQKLTVFSALVNRQRIDYCKSATYTFVDTRSLQPRKIDDLSLDGGVALLKSAVAGRQDVVFIGSRQLTIGEQEYRLSERADVRLRHVAPDELEIIVMDSESGKPVHVQWPSFTAAWRTSNFEVFEIKEGQRLPSKNPVMLVRTGPQLARAKVGTTYRIRI